MPINVEIIMTYAPRTIRYDRESQSVDRLSMSWPSAIVASGFDLGMIVKALWRLPPSEAKNPPIEHQHLLKREM